MVRRGPDELCGAAFLKQNSIVPTGIRCLRRYRKPCGRVFLGLRFHEPREALNYLKEARHFGKVCMRPSSAQSIQAPCGTESPYPQARDGSRFGDVTRFCAVFLSARRTKLWGGFLCSTGWRPNCGACSPPALGAGIPASTWWRETSQSRREPCSAG